MEKKVFSYSGLYRRMSGCCHGPRCSSPVPTGKDELLFGVKPLSDQIRSFRAGGLSVGTRELGDSNYDEDDAIDVDPSIEPGFDRFERAEGITNRISARMKQKYDEKLKHAKTE